MTSDPNMIVLALTFLIAWTGGGITMVFGCRILGWGAITDQANAPLVVGGGRWLFLGWPAHVWHWLGFRGEKASPNYRKIFGSSP